MQHEYLSTVLSQRPNINYFKASKAFSEIFIKGLLYSTVFFDSDILRILVLLDS